jgi:hypothetical protein
MTAWLHMKPLNPMSKPPTTPATMHRRLSNLLSSVLRKSMLSIATHFAQGVGDERRFGTELLKHLATRNKGRPGEEARFALRANGVG